MQKNLAILKKVLFDFGKIHKHAVWIIPAVVLFVGIQLAEPYVYKLIIDRLSDFLSGKVQNIRFADFIPMIGAWFVIVFANLGIKWGYDYWTYRIFYGPWRNAALSIAVAFFKLPYHYHVSVDTSEKTKIASRGSDAVYEINHLIVAKVFPSAFEFIALVCVGFFVHSQVALASLALLPVFAAISMFIGSKSHAIQKSINHLWDKYYGRLGDAFSNILVLKTYVRQNQELQIVDSKILSAIDRQYEINVLWSFLEAGTGIMGFINRTIILGFWTFFILRGEMTIGDLLFFIVIAGRLHGPLVAIESAYRNIVKHLADFSKAEDILSAEKEPDGGVAVFSGLASGIRFESVSFQYPSSSRAVLKDVSIELPKGSRIALVGHTGSGKSTIANLLLRFYDPTQGRVTADGTDVREFTLASYRTKFAAVFQDTTLFNDTLRANLEYVRDGVAFEAVREACKKAEILDFIESLPDGFETVVGERGLKLSGGEMQRISIARAIIADPEILLLDEATSALDSKTERRIQKAFARLMKGRTSLIIAHRLSTIMGSDRIYVVDSGKIMGSGTHGELYEKNETYRELVDAQKDGFVSDSE